MNRERVCGLLLVATLFFLTTGCVSKNLSQSDDSKLNKTIGPIIKTKYGLIKGIEDNENTWSWKGIPFAKAPIGELRWKAPQSVDPWSDTRDASDFGPICPQFDGNFFGAQKVVGSEDCLSLNIWRPQNQEKNLPVYFWIHGGGNTVGSARSNKGFSVAARGDLVVVTIQYRMGPLGWFTHPDLQSGINPNEDSGNFGTLDIIKALEWVKENIANFGGNPDNVMIVGESAGGLNVYSLVLSPNAKGLFHKAMSQSGGFWMGTMDQAFAQGVNAVANYLERDDLEKIPNGDLGDYLRNKSLDEIYSIFSPGPGGMFGMPRVFLDGHVLPEEGVSTLAEIETYNAVPMIIGGNKEETKIFNFMKYSRATRDEYQATMIRQSTAWIRNGVDMPAYLMRGNDDQPPIFAYQLNYGAYNMDGYNAWPNEDMAAKFGACHALDLPFFWHDFNFSPLFARIFREDNKEGYTSLSTAMMNYVARFAHTGAPGIEMGIEWNEWRNEKGMTKRILFDADSTKAILTMSNF